MKTRNQKTVDTQHMQYVEVIRENQVTLSNMQSKINDLSKQIHAIEMKSEKTSKDFDKLLELKDTKIDCNMQYRRLQNDINEHNYLIDNANTLYTYYDLVENGQANKNVFNEKDGKDKVTILSYFAPMKSDAESPASASAPLSCSLSGSHTSSHHPERERRLGGEGGENKEKETDQEKEKEQIQQSRGNLLEKYMAQTDKNYIKSKSDSVEIPKCEHCNSKDITVMLSDGYQYCNCCNSISYVITDNDKPSYRDPPKEISYFAYKRINHYAECKKYTYVVGKLRVVSC